MIICSELGEEGAGRRSTRSVRDCEEASAMERAAETGVDGGVMPGGGR
jgi:hypothetical protein